MKNIFILSAILISQVSFAKDNLPSKKREVASATNCQAPLKDYRAFVLVGVDNGNEKDGADLLAPNGAKSEYIDCAGNLFSTIEVQSDGRGLRTNFTFSNENACQTAFLKIKNATKELPAVIVIDKNCRAHLAK